MTVTTDHTPTGDMRPPAPRGHSSSLSLPARLSLKPANAAPGLLDGAWWPRSRDLVRELPALIDLLDHRGERITRITVNPTLWPVIPRKVPATGHVAHVGWFTEQDPHKLLLLSNTTDRWDLLVIPPQSGAAAAARLMAAATDPRFLLTARGLVANEELLALAESDRGSEEEWESEGGNALPAPGGPAVPYSPAPRM